MARRRLKTGDRIRLKVRTLGGWKGTGTVVCDMAHEDDVVLFAKDGQERRDWLPCVAARHEVSLLRGHSLAMPPTDRVPPRG